MSKDGVRDIFADLYSKVLSFFQPQQEDHDPTKGIAVDRLKNILAQDRVGFSERAVVLMKEEMIVCISKYMEIDADNFELQVEAVDNKTVLNLSIPVIRSKSDEEIDEIEKQLAEKSHGKAQEIVQELEEIIEERAQALADELVEEVSNDDEDGNSDEEGKDEEEERDGAAEEINTDAEIETETDEKLPKKAPKAKVKPKKRKPKKTDE